MKRKVCVVVTARPSYSRILTALKAIQNHPHLELQLVLAASALLHQYGNVLDCATQDGFKVAAKVHMTFDVKETTVMAKTTGLGILKLAKVFERLQPDVVVTIADRYETLATAVAAAYMNIPVAHVQGGEITGSIDEKVRHAVTKLADIHFVATAKAGNHVLRMGEDAQAIHITGCPSLDIAEEILKSPQLNFDPLQKYGNAPKAIDIQQGYLVVMQHPVTTEHNQAQHQITETLRAIADQELPALWFLPNIDTGSDNILKGIESFLQNYKPRNIHFFNNMEPRDFLRLIYNSECLIGNSSVGIREASFLGVPVVNIGFRQKGREHGENVLDVDHDHLAIKAAILDQRRKGRFPSSKLYGDGGAGKKIAHLLATINLTIEKQLIY